MDYKVILSDLAKRQLDDILFYIYATLGNEAAAARVLEDAENTVQKLAQVGGSLKICEEPSCPCTSIPRIRQSWMKL
ncbi:MAG: type II toxin-antitoxin system RelE/ParE family toxin [Acetatifactor sp.]|nr:type II toxin-antitoxin system RelE/ParE family toxin [Acetatifactor sp.]